MSYFKRQIELWGEERQANLKNRTILIVGAGGLGSSVAIALGSSGVGRVYLVDFDRVSISNIHRQIAFKLEDEGKFKARVLASLLESRNSEVKVESFCEELEDFIKRGIKDIDLILDCTDNLPSRAKIDNFAKSLNIPWVYASVEEFNGQVALFREAKFETIFNVKDKKPSGVTPPMVMQIASFEANLALQYLANLEPKEDMLYYISFENGELKTQKFKLPV